MQLLEPWPQSNDFGHISYRTFSVRCSWEAYEEWLELLWQTAQGLGYLPEQQGAGRMNVEKMVPKLIQGR